MRYSPLQIYLAVLTGKDVSSVPLHPRDVKAALDEVIKTPREKEIYLALLKPSHYGDLHYVLNRLREEAGRLHVAASAEVLRGVLNDNWPVDNVLPHIKDLPIAGVFYERVKDKASTQELLESMYVEDIDGKQVCIHVGGKKPNAVAQAYGCDMLAVLRRHGNAQAYAFGEWTLEPPNKFWAQPYDNMLVSNPPRTFRQFMEEVYDIAGGMKKRKS